MTNISPSVIKSLREKSKARYRLSYEFDVHSNTVDRMIDLEEQGGITKLQTPMGVRAIAEELEIKKSEVMA